jgi:excisionase family DNA binding protein
VKTLTSSAKFLSTRQAATRLGVALSTVQAWVETGVLPAWKTAGGHRRIPKDAVQAMQLRQQSTLGTPAAEGLFKILVVEDDPVMRELYRRKFDEWQLPLRLILAEDGFEGLIQAGRHSPDLIIADLAMPGMDGFKMIRKLKSQSAAMVARIIVVTALKPEEIEIAGGLPPGIPVYPKPVSFPALRTLVEGYSHRLTA